MGPNNNVYCEYNMGNFENYENTFEDFYEFVTGDKFYSNLCHNIELDSILEFTPGIKCVMGKPNNNTDIKFF